MKYITKVLSPVKQAHGGQHVPHRKGTAESPSRTFVPDRVVLPLSMHIGAPCSPLVAKGDAVRVGQMIADSDHPLSAPIHASVSGTVSDITEVALPGGRRATAIVLESDGNMEPFPVEKPAVTDVDSFLKAVRNSGLVGLGGAGFPASVKLKPTDKTIDTLVINAAECEPYITADYRECMENADSVFEGVYRLTKWLALPNVVLCVEDNKPKAIETLARIAAADDRVGDRVKLMKLPSSYPQGAEKMLVYSATGRMVPPGGLPADVGCLVMNITSVSFLGKYFRTGMPLVSKRVTVAGSAIAEPGNLIVPIGTAFADLVAFCGGTKVPARKWIAGGPMMGTAIHDLSMPVMKATNALLGLAASDAELPQPSACIRCGRCVSSCPMNLMPLMVEQALAADNVDRLEQLSVLSCMECGCCAFGCPAKRPLVQSMRLAKQTVRGRKS